VAEEAVAEEAVVKEAEEAVVKEAEEVVVKEAEEEEAAEEDYPHQQDQACFLHTDEPLTQNS
jgi:hypothetical protein